ncbi:MAG: PLP-dependent aminotransferase family protein [Fibrobacteres bacterium]|nr:PLP-dependent aminotransferase family protein [Fibrobacterota bacterium]
MENTFRLSDNALGMQASEIRELMKLASKPGIIAFGGGSPDGLRFPFAEVADIEKDWSEAKKRAAFQYGATNGYPPLLEHLRKRMEAYGIDMTDQSIITTTGAQQGIYLMAKALINPGDTIIVESPTFIGALASFKSLRANFEWAPLDSDGISIDATETILKRLAKENRLPKFIYTIPNFQNPSGITLSQAKRKALLELAIKYNVPILEDDPYGELYFEGTAADYKSIKSLPGAKDMVIYLNTFSKILSPGMRLGWITGPSKIIGQIEIAKQSVDACTSSYTQVIASDYLEKGYVNGYVDKMREVYHSKCSMMMLALEKYMPKEVSWSKPTGGFFVWITLPKNIGSKALFTAALKRNVAFVTGSPFTEEGKGDGYARIAFSNCSLEDIEKGVKLLGEAMQEVAAGK